MKIGFGLGIGDYTLRGGGAAVQPFAGNYTWWADINNAVYSNSGGVDYVDTIPLVGTSNELVQPNAVNRLLFNSNGLDGNATAEALTVGQIIYIKDDISVFAGGTGTLALLQKFEGGSTRLLEYESGWNYQIYELGIYTPNEGHISLNISGSDFTVYHFSVSGGQLNFYKNGVLKNTVSFTTYDTPRTFSVFGYKQLFGVEQGYGQLGDIVTLTGTSLTASEIEDDYNNFWKIKYPSLP